MPKSISKKDIYEISKLLKAAGLKQHSILYIIIIFFITALIIGSSLFEARKVNEKLLDPDLSQEFTVTKVVDGDTIDVKQDDQVARIRYIGMNTPETVKPNSPIECFGKEASNYNKSLLEGKKVVLESDIEDTDKNGRLLRYVYFRDDSGKLIMINKKLVEDGYAYAASYPPNVKYQEIFRVAEKEAREAKRGLWRTCSNH